MSSAENIKESGKAKKQKNGNKNNNKKPSAEAIPLKNSPRNKLKKRGSMEQLSEQISEVFTIEMNNDQATVEEPTDTTVRINPADPSSPKVSTSEPKVTVPEPPPTHYAPVVVFIDHLSWPIFLHFVIVNRNMIITKVGRSFLTSLMPGDQISGVDSTPIWCIEDLEHEIQSKPARSVNLTVNRVWNIKCLTNIQLERILPQTDERLQYFMVHVYCSNGTGGLKLYSDKKRVLVQHIRAKTPICHALLVGDQILAINDEFLIGKPKKSLRRHAYDSIKKSFKTKGFAEIIACRPIGARSSPAPSVDAELSGKFANYACGVEKGNKLERKVTDETNNLPLEADALEIALRELTFLQQWVKQDFEEAPCEKGKSLLILKPPFENAKPYEYPPFVVNHQTQLVSAKALSSPVTNTPVAHSPPQALPNKTIIVPVGSTSSVLVPSTTSNALPPVLSLNSQSLSVKTLSMAPQVSQVEPPTSVMNGPTEAADLHVAVPPSPNTPRKRSIFKYKQEKGQTPEHQTTISFVEQPETSKITSDISEDEELKKCDPRSGIVAFIKNKFN